MAFLKPAGIAPSVREQLTSLVIEGRRISKHSFTRKVGHGSSRQDLVGDLVITSPTPPNQYFYQISPSYSLPFPRYGPRKIL